jgi:nicotinamidase-related amidase
MGEFTEEWVRQKAHRLYVEAEAQMDIEPGHTALLVIDMTDEFVKPHWSPYWVPAATRAVPRIKAVIEAFRQAGWPVIYLAYELGQRGLNFPVTDRLVPTTLDTGPYTEFLWKKVSIFADIAPADDDDMHEAELRTLRRGFARIMASPQIIERLAAAAD